MMPSVCRVRSRPVGFMTLAAFAAAISTFVAAGVRSQTVPSASMAATGVSSEAAIRDQLDELQVRAGFWAAEEQTLDAQIAAALAAQGSDPTASIRLERLKSLAQRAATELTDARLRQAVATRRLARITSWEFSGTR